MAAELHSRALPRPKLCRRRRQQQPRWEQRGLPPSLAGSTPLSPPLLPPEADVSLAASAPTCRGCCGREARGPARPPSGGARGSRPFTAVPEGAGPSRQHGPRWEVGAGVASQHPAAPRPGPPLCPVSLGEEPCFPLSPSEAPCGRSRLQAAQRGGNAILAAGKGVRGSAPEKREGKGTSL